jgi:hypothetical protein
MDSSMWDKNLEVLITDWTSAINFTLTTVSVQFYFPDLYCQEVTFFQDGFSQHGVTSADSCNMGQYWGACSFQ